MNDSTVIHGNETETFRGTKDDCQPKLGALGWDDGTDTTAASVSSSTTIKRSNVSIGKGGKMNQQKKSLEDFVNGLPDVVLQYFLQDPQAFLAVVFACVENGDTYREPDLVQLLNQAATRSSVPLQMVQGPTQPGGGTASTGGSTPSVSDVSSANRGRVNNGESAAIVQRDDSSASGQGTELLQVRRTAESHWSTDF